MTRSDAESILEFVRIQLERIEPGAHMILAGSYRRGKTEINDVDILITYPHVLAFRDVRSRWPTD
jgi:DNA polymerase/3'-5' exonuclease PolX